MLWWLRQRDCFQAYEVGGDFGETSCLYALRWTLGTRLLQNEVSFELIQQLLGHTQVETTMIYAHADTEMKRTAIQKADAVRKAKPVPDEIWANNEEMILKLSRST